MKVVQDAEYPTTTPHRNRSPSCGEQSLGLEGVMMMPSESNSNSNEEDEDDNSSNSSHSDSHDDSSAPKDKPLANRETRKVWIWKLIVLAVLLLSTIVTVLAVHMFIQNSDTEQFEQAFATSAQKVLQAVDQSLETTLAILDGLAVSIVSHAHNTNQTWPEVLVPDFAISTAKILALTNAVWVALLPLVTNETRSSWERFAASHDQWLNESVQLQETYNLYHGPLDYATGHVNAIWGDFGDIEYDIERDLLPAWQNYPVINDVGYPAYNWDWLSMAANEAPSTALYQHRVVISEAYMLPDPLDPVAVEETKIWSKWLSGLVQPGEPYDEPASDLYFPIFDQLEQIRAPSSVQDDSNNNSNKEYDPSQHRVVGTLVATMLWRNLLQDILPPDLEGIVVVFENPCNPTFTYRINGPSVEYLGRGDFHDTTYDDLEMTSHFFQFQSLTVSTSMYSGPPLDTEFCPFRLRVFPSDTMKADYSDQASVIFPVTVVCIFIFTMAIFCFYDCKVEHRQRLILKKAERSTAIVASLFPTQVQEQLADAIVGAKNAKAKDKMSAFKNSALTPDQISQRRMRAFLEDGDDIDDDNDVVDPNGPAEDSPPSTLSRKSPPIASLYPETTVMFADIAGFTQWSSTRQPTDVFTLLEALYEAFDAIAKRRKVFKVETIGDCYVAVTGLPTPEPRHAVIMAKFAKDCRDKMEQVTKELESTLGPETSTLSLRVGLHSGPTTAGVLRGDKSRFQLFGDTVNTSARMESNGLPNKIHVSQATADILMAAGKGLWLTKREELIEAKGKGKMQTWWVTPTSTGTGSVGTGNSSSHLGRVSRQGSVASGLGSSENDEGQGWEVFDGMTDLDTLKSLDAMISQKPQITCIEELYEDFDDMLSV